jgi:hypothetical protein
MRGGALTNTKSIIADILSSPAQAASAATEVAIARNMTIKTASAALLPTPQHLVTGDLIARDRKGLFFPIGQYRFSSNYEAAKGTIGVGSGNTWLTRWEGGYTKNETWFSIEVGQISVDNFPAWQTIQDLARVVNNTRMITDGSVMVNGDRCMYFKLSNASGTSEVILSNCFSRVRSETTWVLLSKVNLTPTDAALPTYPGIHSFRGSPNGGETYTLSVALTSTYVPPLTAPPAIP